MQETSVQEHLQKLPLAMAYVPMQKFGRYMNLPVDFSSNNFPGTL